MALALAAICGVSLGHGGVSRVILGPRPSYGPALVSDGPNLAAVDRMLWMPGLDAGWDPQGLAFAEGNVFVSAYQSRGAWQFRGPCRVFRVDPESGTETGHVDVPAPCGHAGGLAYAGGRLFVADTHNLFEIDLDHAFGEAGAKYRDIPLGRGLKGAFAVSSKGAVWIGDYQEERPAGLFKFDLAAIEALRDGAPLTAGAASAIVAIATYAQGGAVDGAGDLWISRSDVGWGFLEKLDAVSGHLKARYPMPAGIEGIAFDPHGRLWAVCEAGARHLPLRYPFFPLIFRLDPLRLAPAE